MTVAASPNIWLFKLPKELFDIEMSDKLGIKEDILIVSANIDQLIHSERSQNVRKCAI